MPGLTPPPNYENVYKLVALGFICVGIILATKSNHNHHTGDQQHSLPFGGIYRDGTKTVSYFRPSDPITHSNKWLAFSSVITISLIIWLCSKFSPGDRRPLPPVCSHCTSH
ncbi:triple gene block protein 2 [Potexvirus ecsalstroemeriae]|uniref:Triple gene block protein 2 n=1 Tax=Potexvirus ecsalstroemeriae TaxID=316983 RepID=Q3V6G5_9VIRU|nr:triple gene block protein 2 [Alstroemeria virus X]BAE44213.1 triple gene block protein 2 [Alstroemeria virus X]